MEEQRGVRLHIKHHFKQQENRKYQFGLNCCWVEKSFSASSPPQFLAHILTTSHLSSIKFSSAKIRKLRRDLYRSSGPAHKSLSPPSSKLIWHIAIPKRYFNKPSGFYHPSESDHIPKGTFEIPESCKGRTQKLGEEKHKQDSSWRQQGIIKSNNTHRLIPFSLSHPLRNITTLVLILYFSSVSNKVAE